MSTMFSELPTATPTSLISAGLTPMPFQIGQPLQVQPLGSMVAQQPTALAGLMAQAAAQVPQQVQAVHPAPIQVQQPSNPQLAQVALNQGYTGNSATDLPAMVELATMIGAKPTPQVINALLDWHQAEGGSAAFNPFNTTQSMPGSTSYNSIGVQNFVSPKQGLAATADTLENGRYGTLLQALRSGASTGQLAQDIAQSPWGTGGLVEQVAAGNYANTTPQQIAQAVSSLGGQIAPSSLSSTVPATINSPASVQAAPQVATQQQQPAASTGLPPNLSLASSLFGNNPILQFALQRMAAQRAQQQQPASTPAASNTPAAPAGTVVPSPRNVVSGHTSMINPAANFGRVDQGVDYSQNTPYLAPGAGVIYGTSGFGGGSDQAVYERLNKPITVNGHTYRDVYAAETTPMVHVGEHVKAGQPLQGPGSAEIGFAGAGTGPIAPLIGGLGAGTQPTQAGRDMLAYLQSLQRKR